MSLSKEEIQKVAKLARLKIEPQEEEKYAGQLSAILNYIDQLKELNQEGEPEFQGSKQTLEQLRPDVTDGGRHQSEILKGAPQRQESYFQVPAVFETNDEV